MEDETKPKEEPKPELTAREKLKAENDALDAELERGRRLIQEQKEIEAQKLLGGGVGGNVPPVVKVDTPQEYAEKVMTGKIKAQ